MVHNELIWYSTNHVSNSAFVFLSVSLSKKCFVRSLETFRFNIVYNSIFIHYGVLWRILTVFDENVFSEWNVQLLPSVSQPGILIHLTILFTEYPPKIAFFQKKKANCLDDGYK